MDSGNLSVPADPYDSEDETINKIIALKTAGNRQWVVDFLKAFGPQVKGALMGRFKGLLNMQDIEDVIQDFAKEKCELPDGFDPNKGPLKPFCYRNMCWIARRKITKMNELPMLPDTSTEDLEDLADCDAISISPAQIERILILKEAINELPPRQQEVVREYIQYRDFLTLKQIAESMGITPNTFSVSLNHAKKGIKEFFASRGYDTDTLEKNT